MFGIRFIKSVPTTYILHYSNGRLKREGSGISFFYYAPTSSIVAIPVNTVDLPFIFNETTKEFQTITVQGQLSYRVVDPKRLSSLLNFSIRPTDEYLSDDPTKLGERLINSAQSMARTVIQGMNLKEVLLNAEPISVRVFKSLKESELVLSHGVEVMALSILSIRPTPEIGKALEAEARELLQRKADEAIYARRNAAVEQERTIKESELNTEIAVEEKRKQIRETQMKAEIAVEEQRAVLVDQRIKNDKKEADSKAYALEATIRPIKELDWRTLMAITSGGVDAKSIIALAFRDIAEHAEKIGQLNITPDLLQTILSTSTKPAVK